MSEKKQSILEEAQNHVYGDRAASHGPFDANFKICAEMYNAWTGKTISPVDVAQILICLKAARYRFNPENRDNLVDLAGYAELLFRLSGPKDITVYPGLSQEERKRVESIIRNLKKSI